MIPPINVSSVLPPSIGPDADGKRFSTPYKTDTLELSKRFGFSIERQRLLLGFLDFRRDLSQLGIIEGWQWLDGSFVEDVEALQQRAPRDIDLVTYGKIHGSTSQKNHWFETYPHLFMPDEAKQRYGCDAYFMDLSSDPQILAKRSFYWASLFSHQRETNLWKGILELKLHSPDEDAAARRWLTGQAGA